MNTQAKITLSAEDKTKAAFASAAFNAEKLGRDYDTLKASAIGALSALAAPVSVAGLVSVFNESRRAIDGIKDLADATGSGVEAISALDKIARYTGGNLETVSSILVRFNGVLAEADPKKGVGASLKAIGLSVEELKRLDPAEALRVTAVAVEKLGSETDKARIYQELFGKSVRDAAPFFKDLAEARQLDAALTAAQIEQMDRYNKEMAKLSGTATDVGRSLSIGLATEINSIIKKFEDAERAGKNFLRVIFLTPAEMERKNRAAGVFGMTPLQELQRAQEQIRTLEKAPLSLGETDREQDPRMIDARARVARLTPIVQAAGGGRGFVNPRTIAELPPDRPKLPDPKPTIKPIPTPQSLLIRPDQELDAITAEFDAMNRLRDDRARRAAQITDQVRTPLEKLAATEAELDRLRRAGLITDETLARARFEAAEEFDAAMSRGAVQARNASDATDVAISQAKSLGAAFSNTFDRAFQEGTKVSDLLKKLAFDAINIQFLTPATQKLGSTLGAAVSSLFSFDGGGYTGSGSRSGGIDGKGGFLSVLHPNETVLDHTKGQGMGGGVISFSYTIDARGADAGVEDRLRSALAESEARMRSSIVPTVLQARRTSTGFASALRGS